MTLQFFHEAEIPCPVVTGGGTGTYPFEAASGVFTEIQPGSYALMDVDYNKVWSEWKWRLSVGFLRNDDDDDNDDVSESDPL